MPLDREQAAAAGLAPPLKFGQLFRILLLRRAEALGGDRVPERKLVAALLKQGLTPSAASATVRAAEGDGLLERHPGRLTRDPSLGVWLRRHDGLSLLAAGKRILRRALSVERLRPPAEVPNPRTRDGRVYWRAQCLRAAARWGNEASSHQVRRELQWRGLGSAQAGLQMRRAVRAGHLRVVGRDPGSRWVLRVVGGVRVRDIELTGRRYFGVTAAGKQYVAEHAGVPDAPLVLRP
jgi:hypothetical protein